MSVTNAQNRACSFWKSGSKKKGSLNGAIKQMMLRGAHGRSCPICGMVMIHYPGEIVDHNMPSAATIEHILPRSLGGTHAKENLATICNGCNRARGVVFNNLTKNLESIQNYVAWLFIQMENPAESADHYPLEHAWFCLHWRHLYDFEYSPPNPIQRIRRGKRRTLDMSASARQRSVKRGV